MRARTHARAGCSPNNTSLPHDTCSHSLTRTHLDARRCSGRQMSCLVLSWLTLSWRIISKPPRGVSSHGTNTAAYRLHARSRYNFDQQVARISYRSRTHPPTAG